MDEDGYKKWQLLIPYLYDWFANHNLTWPSLGCRWGQVEENASLKCTQRLYLSEQTDGSAPNKLVVASATIVKPRVASADVIARFNPLHKNPCIKQLKTIYHPGEVNKIRELPQHPSVVITHTDAPQLYVWSTEQQPSWHDNKVALADMSPNKPDLVLTGHEDDAPFALATSSQQPMVASGGKDKRVLLWDIEDHATSLARSSKRPAEGAETEVRARTVLKGHTETIEEVAFQPGSTCELASVADDSALLLWDTRSGTEPVLRIADAHGAGDDVHTVDWGALRPDLLATGAANGSVKVWDRRKLGAAGSQALHTFAHHTGPVMRVEWAPQSPGVLASGGDDRRIAIWDLNRSTDSTEDAGDRRTNPYLVFQHTGHRAPVVDFQWAPEDPWTLMSVSDDAAGTSGGGTLQLWRVNDMIYRPSEEVLQELEQHREFIITGKEPSMPEGVVSPASGAGVKAEAAAAAPSSAVADMDMAG